MMYDVDAPFRPSVSLQSTLNLARFFLSVWSMATRKKPPPVPQLSMFQHLISPLLNQMRKLSLEQKECLEVICDIILSSEKSPLCCYQQEAWNMFDKDASGTIDAREFRLNLVSHQFKVLTFIQFPHCILSPLIFVCSRSKFPLHFC